MKKKATVLIASIMAFCGINTAHADEGMWTIYNLPNAVYEMMQREGFSMTYDQLYNGENALKNAVVNFSGYCSGVVVSRRFGIYQPPLRFRGYQKPLYRGARLYAQRFLC